MLKFISKALLFMRGMIVFNFKAHIGIGLASSIGVSLLLGTTVSKILSVNIGVENYYYFGGAVLGAIIPDLDHHSSVVNRRLLALLEIVLKIIIPGILYQILYIYGALEFTLNIAISAAVFVALLKINLKKKWALKLLYVLFGLLLFSSYGISIKSLLGAITLVCIGYFPHRGYTHEWYGLVMITMSLYLFWGINGLFVGTVVGMISHIISDGLKSALHI